MADRLHRPPRRPAFLAASEVRPSASARRRTVIAVAVLAVVSIVAAPVSAGSLIDLDRHGALEALERSNSAHHAKVRAILEGVVLTHLRGEIVPLR